MKDEAEVEVQGLFGIDPDGPDEMFTGWYVPGGRDGWPPVPGFERDQVERIIAWVTGRGDETTWTSFAWDGDVLVMTDHDYDEVRNTRYEADEDGRYRVGADEDWLWSLVEGDVTNEEK